MSGRPAPRGAVRTQAGTGVIAGGCEGRRCTSRHHRRAGRGDWQARGPAVQPLRLEADGAVRAETASRPIEAVLAGTMAVRQGVLAAGLELGDDELMRPADQLHSFHEINLYQRQRKAIMWTLRSMTRYPIRVRPIGQLTKCLSMPAECWNVLRDLQPFTKSCDYRRTEIML